MRCPFCGEDNTRVVDSRPVEDTNSIRRRRMCESCGKRFTTYEKVETIPLSVIKKDQNREPYSRSKIQDGILRACYKRPIPVEKIEETMDCLLYTSHFFYHRIQIVIFHAALFLCKTFNKAFKNLCSRI